MSGHFFILLFIIMDSNADLSLYPDPPKHYKQFIREDSMSYPDLNFLSRMETFMTFGKEYKTKEINTNVNTVDTEFLKHFDSKLLEYKNIPNKFFTEPNFTSNTKNVENLTINIFDAIQSEVNFIKKTYLDLLDQTSVNIDECDLSNCLIKFAFQKIYFFISLLKKKQIFIEMISYFKSEIEKNTCLENTLTSNLEKCQQVFISGLNKIKEIN